MEVELKLLVSPQDAEALRQHPLLKKYATSKPHEQKMSDIYFDTPELDIRPPTRKCPISSTTRAASPSAA